MSRKKDCIFQKKNHNPSGYAITNIGDKKARTHRLEWAKVFGPIPEGFDLHHKCYNKGCINPDHLEAMSHSEHMKLSRKEEEISFGSRQLLASLRMKCKQGHFFTTENTYMYKGYRYCRTCNKEKVRRFRKNG